MVTLTRGVCRAMPRFFAIAWADVITPRAMRPCPPSFPLANTKTVSPSAICLPPYIVFCAVNANVFARESQTSALIANAMLLLSENSLPRQLLAQNLKLQPLRLGRLDPAVQLAKRCGSLLESGTVARVVLRIVELRLQLGGFRAQCRDRGRQGFERVLVLERHPPPRRLRLLARRRLSLLVDLLRLRAT